ncbi:MAG: hypothetical protein RIS35_682, partial [Pseudomonadota bacterium]
MRQLVFAVLALAATAAGAQTVPPAAVAAEPASENPARHRAPSLGELVERAWRLARGIELREARSAELDARDAATRAAFPDAPSIGFDLRRDLPTSIRLPGTDPAAGRGRNELEPNVSMPLWLPGQRDAQRDVISRDRDRLEASARLERLRLAGEVREAVWAAALARSELNLQRGRLEAALTLEADVIRRIGAGDLAPVDRLHIRAEALAATAALREAQARHAQALVELQRLTGADAFGGIEESPPAEALSDDHPALEALREAVGAARARLALAKRTRRDNPTLSAAARFDRDAYGVGYRNTVRVGVSVPLDTEARNVPRIAAASADLTEAEIALERRWQALSAEVERARIGVAAARDLLATGTERLEAVREALNAIERAFRAGERGLPEV